MPNWCENGFKIEGPILKIKQIWETSNKGENLLNALVPQPENIFRGDLGAEERQRCKELGIPNWYDWGIVNWGTKWDIDFDQSSLEFNDNGDGTASIDGFFCTAWCPPLPCFETYASTNPDVRAEIQYRESGVDYLGIATFENGVLYDEYYGDIATKYRKGELPERIVNDFGLDEWYEDYEWVDEDDEEEAA